MYNLNDTCLTLEWSPPSDPGGRRDLTYNVLCKRCGSAAAAAASGERCRQCEEDLRFLPRPVGLVHGAVAVMDFSIHANYTFEVESFNGVSQMSTFPPPVASITVSTEQRGKRLPFFFHVFH
ncbi:hypothetical protein CRUP_024493 [Coryphaenoides rupestris]|nr:hypothetical protein CRUP_024493 [Coryphaenoides rupestris]